MISFSADSKSPIAARRYSGTVMYHGHNQPLAAEGETLIDLLRRRAADQPSRQAFTFLEDGESEVATLTFGQLDLRSRSIAALLESVRARDERVLLLYPPGLDYVCSFLGCLYERAVAVPVPPPRFTRTLDRLAIIASDSGARVVLTTRSLLTKARGFWDKAPVLRSLIWLATDDIDAQQANDWHVPSVNRNTIAFLQYTSGSTTTPRGVMVTHGNLLHNERLIQEAFSQSEHSVILSWLPLYHDMGLIGGVLQPLYLGARCILMSPLAFLQRPIRWLRAISKYRVTTSGGPDSAYDLCTHKAAREDCSTLDLSSWTVAFNGSEPIREDTIRKFTQAFEPFGFNGKSFFPCYGLAEATLLVSAGHTTSRPLIKAVQGDALKNNRIADADLGEGDTRPLVASGRIHHEQRVVIVDPESKIPCATDQVGEIWVSGSSIAQGYYNRPAETEQTFHAYLAGTDNGPFLRTGDLGFIKDRELFVTGRIKDLIIIRGQNYYPQDIELTVQRISSALRQAGGAAFSIEIDGRERLAVVQEVALHSQQNADEIIDLVRQAVADEHGLSAHTVVLVKKGSIPKTSSGKIRRHACRAEFLNGNLNVIAQWTEPASLESQIADAIQDPVPSSLKETEQWLVSALCAKLGMEPHGIDVDQPISRYGLDSLAAIDLIHRMGTRFGVSIPAATLFEIPRISEIAKLVFQLTDEPLRIPHVPRLRESVKEFGLSKGQQALHFFHELAPDVTAYNISVLGTARTQVDSAALRQAFQKLINRHPSLRANFIQTSEGPVQRIHEHLEPRFREVDATTWTTEELNDRIVEEADHRFNLEKDRLLRITLYRRPQEVLLMMVANHIVVDLWSLGLIVKELGLLYSADADAELGTPESEFSDYVEWQDQLLASAEGDRLWEYWKDRLGGELPALDLPTDHPRPPNQTYPCGSWGFRLTSKLAERLDRLCRTSGTTPFMFLAAAFEALLHRYTGQDEILLGALTSGRSQARFAEVVGYFVNPVILRGDFSKEQTFDSFLSRTRTTILEALQHQDYPFPLLVEKLQKGRDASRPPLAQAMFVYQKAHLPDQEALTRLAVGETGATVNIGEIEVEFLPLNQRATQFDLTLKMGPTCNGIGGSLEYNSDLFDASTMTRMADHFQILITECLSNPQKRIADLSIIGETQRKQLLSEWNDTRIDYPDTQCIHSLIETQVTQTPDAIAVSFEGYQVTYGELNARANRIAHYLIGLGAGPETRVGICMARSVEMLVGLLGILKSGGAYVPLDSALPQSRLSLMIEDSGIGVVVTQSRLIENLPEEGVDTVCLDAGHDRIWRESNANPACVACSENLAYLIFTSGSTGKPKGVMVSHRNVVNLFHAVDTLLGTERAGSWLAATSISFDISVVELLWSLSRGLRVVIQGEQDRMSGSLASEESAPAGESYSVPEQIRRNGITHFQCTPSMASLFAYGPESLSALQTLDKLLVAGEALPLPLAQELGEIVSPGELFNLYGPTETTIYSTADLVERAPERITIGRPIANTEAYSLDRELEPVPINVPGALYIGGQGVGRGYSDAPDLTAERFIPDPLSERAGSRLYATGDVSRHIRDGRIEFLGRSDQQVKLRGYRIELGEIEAALDRHSAVHQSAVVVQERSQGEKYLVAYVVVESGSSLNISEMREFLKGLLPETMIPSVLVRLDAMPMTPSGKIFRRGLPTFEPTGAEANKTFAPPRSPLEQVLVELWADILELDRVGIDDNFFEIGGHSILASKFISRLRETVQVELPLRTFFSSPTVAGLAEAMIKDGQQGTKALRIAELLISVANYSEDEVEAILDASR